MTQSTEAKDTHRRFSAQFLRFCASIFNDSAMSCPCAVCCTCVRLRIFAAFHPIYLSSKKGETIGERIERKTIWNRLALYKRFVYLCALVQSLFLFGGVCVCLVPGARAHCICLHLQYCVIARQWKQHNAKTNKQHTVHCRIRRTQTNFTFPFMQMLQRTSPSQWVRELAANCTMLGQTE